MLKRGLAITMQSIGFLLCFLLLLFAGNITANAAEGIEPYTIKNGDSWASIASYCGMDADLIAAMNNMCPGDVLPVGQVIQLPVEPKTAITVQKGDTLWGIAQRYDIRLSTLLSCNSIDNPSLLHCGDTIYLPIENAEMPVRSNDIQLASRSSSSSATGFQKPLDGVVTQKFTGTTHHGLDIAAPKGTVIGAVKDGKVTFAGWKNAIYGNSVMIQHYDDTRSFYAHCGAISVAVGDTVQAGSPIAKVGMTGKTTGPHLHLQIWVKERLVNPQDYLSY